MSVSSVSLSSDANVRYQRLAAEYTKLRAQAKVLREGVLEERGRVDKLTEDLKSKEAVIRRLQAENESLTFRNDQLVRRVETFQFEPVPLQTTPRKPTKAPPSSTDSAATTARIELLEQELKQKLEQNERLVGELADNERQHAVEMAEMSEKLAKEMRKLEDEVRRMRMRTKVAPGNQKHREDSELDLDRTLVEEEQEDSKQTEMVIGSPEPPESQEEARIMVAEATRGTFSGLTNVFTLLQQRCEIYPYDIKLERLPSHVEKLSSEYAQTARLFSNLVEITDSIIQNSIFEPETQIPEVTSKCRLISQHCNQMLVDLVKQMTSEENRVTWCTPPLSKLNQRWEELMLKMFEVFEDVTKALETLNIAEDTFFLDTLDSLDSVTTQLLDCFQKRWVFEARLPTTTRRMRCVGSALEEALQMTSQETSKLAARTRRVTVMEKEREESSRRRQEEAENLEREIEKEEMMEREKKKETPESYNPFEDDDEEDFKDASEEPPEAPMDPQTMKTPESHRPLFSIAQKTPGSESQKSSKSEVPYDPEHLHSELRLLLTLNEELQKERDKLFVDNSLVKRKLEIATSSSENQNQNPTSDMDQIWAIGMERRDEWIQRVFKAEKAVRFYEIEFELLLRHELTSEEHLKRVMAELDNVAKQNHRLEDELESVRRSYESQLGDLSEHLATLVKEREKDKESSKSRGSLKSFFNKSSS